jgi:ABC-type phosphate transport system ATPase subunit
MIATAIKTKFIVNEDRKEKRAQLLAEAARCSDRTAFFYLGRLIEYADTRDIFTKPANPQTEAYVSGRFG